MRPLFQINTAKHNADKVTATCNKSKFKLGPNNKILAGRDETIAIGKKVNNTFLKVPVYIESGLREYFVNSLESHPPTEKFLYQNTRQAIVNSTQYKISIPIINEAKNTI